MGEKKKKSIWKMARGFAKRCSGDHVGAYSAQAAYFLILSFIPFILFLTTMIPYTPLTYNTLHEAIVGVLPRNLQGFVLQILADVYLRSTAVLPISVIFALWSAGKGMHSMTNGLNSVFHVNETRNWLIIRIYSVLYTLLFSIAIVVSLLMLVLGNRIQALIARYLPFISTLIARIMGARTFLVFAMLFLVFLALYKVLPNRRATLKSQVPGALLAATSWSVFSYFFSLYFTIFPGSSNMYGSLAALVMLMLWLYVCMNLLLYGAEVNAYFENEFRKAQASMREMLSREKEEQEKEKNSPNSLR